MTASPMLKVADVASRLDVDALTVRRWIAAGDLTAYKIGREYRVESSDFDAFLAARRTESAPVDTVEAPLARTAP